MKKIKTFLKQDIDNNTGFLLLVGSHIILYTGFIIYDCELFGWYPF